MKQLIFICLMSLSIKALCAPLANSNNSQFYYEIGGARSISLPPNTAVKTVSLNASSEYGLGYSCGNFDPTLGLSNILNGIKGTGNNLVNGAVGAVTSAIGSLPALIMQRIDPGLYDLFQNALIRAEATLALANKSCEQYEEQINNGKNPYADWTDLSKVIDWKVQMGNQGFGSSKVDVVEAKKTVAKNNGDKGVPWIGGKKAGGQSQTPIKATYDVVKAGYNLTLNRKADETKAPKVPKGSVPPRMVEIWKDPDEASKWAVDVLGDVYIRTFDNHKVETTPGHGLLPKIEKENTQITTDLVKLVSGKSTLSLKNLNEVSSNSVLINADVIKAIRVLGPSEQTIAASKLASEAAMSKVLEKALIIRRMLITGGREPNVSQTEAHKFIQESVLQLDRDINDVLFERRIHTELASQTPKLILDLKTQHENRSYTQQREAGNEEKLIEDGAVK